MPLSELTDSAAVRRAVEEFDAIGREAFLKRYECAQSKSYFLLYRGKTYDSKAIVIAAFVHQHGRRPEGKVSPGQEGAVAVLKRLGFTMAEAKPPWHEDEMVLALHTYLAHRGEYLSKRHPAIVQLSDRLRRLAPIRGMVVVAPFRNVAGIEQQVGMFHTLDPKSEHEGRGTPSKLHVAVWDEYSRSPRKLGLRAHQVLNELEAGPRPRSPTKAPTSHVRDRGAARRIERSMIHPDALDAPYKRIRVARAPRVVVAEWKNLDDLDRGTEAHEVARSSLRDHLLAAGFEVHQGTKGEVEYDLSAKREDLRLVVEVKSLPRSAGGQSTQLRLGLGQLLWYRHCYRDRTDHEPVAVLMVGREPQDLLRWRGTCTDVNVVLTWPGRFESLVDDCKIANGRRAKSPDETPRGSLDDEPRP